HLSAYRELGICKSRGIAAWCCQIADKCGPNGIDDLHKYNRNRIGDLLSRSQRERALRQDYIRFQIGQFGGLPTHKVKICASPTNVDLCTVPIPPTEFLQSMLERHKVAEPLRIITGETHKHANPS